MARSQEQQAAPQAQREWYVTATHGGYIQRGKSPSYVPVTPVHLKRLGELRTACGLSAVNWQIFWLEEPSTMPTACRTCLRLTAESRVALNSAT